MVPTLEKKEEEGGALELFEVTVLVGAMVLA